MPLDDYRRQHQHAVDLLYEKENARANGYEIDPCPNCDFFTLAKRDNDTLECDNCGEICLAADPLEAEAL